MCIKEISELVAVVAKHDPVMLARIAAVYDRRVNKRTPTALPQRKGRKTY